MDRSPYKNPENKNGGPLKTTTWGALIASSLLLAGLGLTGHLSRPGGGSQVIETAASSAPVQAPTVSSVAKGSYGSGVRGGALNGASALHPLFGVRPGSANAANSAAIVGGSSIQQ